MVLSIIKGAPFIRTTPQKISQILELARLAKDDIVVDLGSGNGSIMIAVAQSGFIAHGYEINLFLVIYTWIKIRKLGLQDKAFVHWGNMWRVDTSKYTLVTVYGFPSIMNDLEVKLQRELPQGARVISNSFQFPHWKLSDQKGAIFLYINS